jgi:hypothetical protein
MRNNELTSATLRDATARITKASASSRLGDGNSDSIFTFATSATGPSFCRFNIGNTHSMIATPITVQVAKPRRTELANDAFSFA